MLLSSQNFEASAADLLRLVRFILQHGFMFRALGANDLKVKGARIKNSRFD